jgi:hypothetical protein
MEQNSLVLCTAKNEGIKTLEKKLSFLNDTLPGLITKYPGSNNVLGYAEDVLNITNGFVLRKWAGNLGNPKSITIEIYVGGPIGAGTFLKQARITCLQVWLFCFSSFGRLLN